jgi:hypothetical protein
VLEMKMRDGTVFDPLVAAWTITPKGSDKIYGWNDVVLLGMLEPLYDVVHGTFGPAKMPIRGVRFTDTSDLQVEVPMPLQVAREMGALLASSKIKVVKQMPTFLILRGGLPR